MRLIIASLILAINQIALAEGLALGRSLGIDPVLLHNVVNTSSGTSWRRARSHCALRDMPIRNRKLSGNGTRLEPLYGLILCSLSVRGADPRSGQSWSSRVNSPLPEVANSPGSRGYSGGFQSRLMLKASRAKPLIPLTKLPPFARTG